MEGPERGPWVDATGRWRHYLRHPASLNLSLLIHYRLPAPTFDFLYFSKKIRSNLFPLPICRKCDKIFRRRTYYRFTRNITNCNDSPIFIFKNRVKERKRFIPRRKEISDFSAPPRALVKRTGPPSASSI